MAVSIQITVLGLGYSPQVVAEPIFMFGSDIRPLIGTSRSQLVAIYNQGTVAAPDFRMARPVVIPVGQDGKIIWFRDDSWRDGGLQASDRLILEEDMLGAPAGQPFVFNGCLPRRGQRLEFEGRTVWLTSCDEAVMRPLNGVNSRVAYDPGAATVASRFYSYKFKPRNHMLFEQVIFTGKKSEIIASDSDLYIRSDIKNFFTLNFHSGDIESRLEDHRPEPLSQLASLGFYLRVLFFKLTLDLRTDVAFFESSANIPMVMTLPVNAAKRLNHKSGVLYSFKVGDGIDLNALRTSMPYLNPALLDGDVASAGLVSCGRVCEYSLEVPAQDKRMILRIAVTPDLVKKGLFPWFVPDVNAVQKKMNWSLPQSLDLKKRVGLYLEVSGLPKGSHPWDLWISFK